MIASLYEARSNRCGTCGRRFFANEEGKEKKARHLDWHFRTNQRMAEAAKRGQNRSWYVDERVSIPIPVYVLGFLANTLDRIGSNRVTMTMTKALRIVGRTVVQRRLMAARPRRARRSNGSAHRTMRRYETHHVQSAKRSLSRHGRRKYRTGFGRMPSRWAAECTTAAATPRSQRMDPLRGVEEHPWGELVLPTQFWGSERRR